ncbi:hypothetical protein PYCCODRAFT_1447814 [Trametes coccinea BRFM310]|uniref:CST complex subunit STN1 n=1 Tax=Trametes coccinea (strain BRFM310) TaxID=1353009 RepID=A0A1Y2I9I6_TRAC3|nr:hypothetical protein PYCCODRAFT_1447814 [Trametes coccinea BRFM310]
MRESGSRDMEYFWIGRVPCRTVCLVGLVVGVVVWEKRTVYTVDDGTAVVDCAHAHQQAVPPSPAKQRSKDKASNAFAKKTNESSYADYLRPTRPAPYPSMAAAKRAAAEPPPLPRPVARVGQAVRIVGRVISRHDTRSLLVDEISLCASSNDEPTHWITVTELHRTTYYPTEKLPPFVPPPFPSTTSNPSAFAHSQPGTPSRHASDQRGQIPGTPASVHSSVTSAASTPSASVSGSSPVRTADAPQSPVRLRHPSRLHTRDLTVHTLRIYIKHYMDNAPPPTVYRRTSRSRSVSPSPTPRHTQRRAVLDTPTTLQKGKAVDYGEETPRPSRVRSIPAGGIPRQSIASGVDSDTEEEDDGSEAPENGDQVYGYTLSHLRRVPELALLARRIVKAEARRREKEERKKAKAASSSTAPKPANTTSSLDAKTEAAATKRLFRQAIRTLFQEGSIVLWDGPTRPLPQPPLDPLAPPSSFSAALWKANTSTSTSSSASTAPSKSGASRSFPSYDEWDDDEEPLSEPAPGEEAYIPLTPAYFSRVLERAITGIMAETSAASPGVDAGAGASDATPRAARKQRTSLIERLRAQESRAGGGSAPGPTAQELLAWLRNSDERWARVGLWSVEEALEWGRKEGRVWCVGKGRWELCG